MNYFDGHSDVLLKMFKDKTINFQNSEKLHITKEGLQKGGAKIQCFAIYIPESVHPDMKFEAALSMTTIFYEKILQLNPDLKFIRNQKDIEQLKEEEIGAILTLEGCDAIGADLLKLKTLLQLGVSAVGLTWNYANAVADGALEPRGAGLSLFGRETVKLLNQQDILVDVSHLSENSFWDVMELGDHPYASHSNAYNLCPHPRNLKDEQIKALIEADSVIGITFVPQFLSGSSAATITDVLRHLDYICSLGGEDHVGFGSDFDGISQTVKGLASTADYPNLINELTKYYTSSQVEKFLYTNMVKRFPK
ncbi:dipeptidase [Niallia sp. FSL W8-0635]|uniref:dipeptidase n=1 Tax=Niallia sp. FSL W8-0635 TaxID=2975337 RepID=UPI0030F73487